MSEGKINSEEKHIVAQREDTSKADDAARATRLAEPTPEERARAAILCEINITVFKDGNLSINGPWNDRILFEGAIAITIDAIRQQYMKITAANAPRIQRPNLSPADLQRLRVRGG